MILAAVVGLEPEDILGLDVAMSARISVVGASVALGDVSVDGSQSVGDAMELFQHPTDALLSSLWRRGFLPEVAQVPVGPAKQHVVTITVPEGE